MKMQHPRRRPVVAILGGGLTGAATAFHLAKATRSDEVDIVVIEPREAIGAGLAYSTTEPAHRINVPAARMTLISADADHFVTWLASEHRVLSPGTATLSGDLFPARAIFGQYVAEHLAPFLANGAIRHLRVTAISARESNGRYSIDLSDDTSIDADIVVLAMSHPKPFLPAELRTVAGSRRLVADPYDNARVNAIGPTDRVLIVGTGLTSADVIATLHRRGFWGEITAVSRRGLRSLGHGPAQRKNDVDFADDPAPTARLLLRRIRDAVAADAVAGFTWHTTLDRMREQGQAAWAGLDLRERARLVRHLRVYWDIHRFRIAPQVEEVLEAQISLGKLNYMAARLVRAEETDDGIEVEVRPRHHFDTETKQFDTVVVTTGPSHSDALRTNSALRSLATNGVIRPDPLGLGIAVDDYCRAVGASGEPSASLFVTGPLARGHVGELMGVPEVTVHAECVAAAIYNRLHTTVARTVPRDAGLAVSN